MMSSQPGSAWSPTRFLLHEDTLGTSMQTAIVQTNAGRAHIKVMGNPQGEHTLACEYICTQLAEWFGVPILDYAILPITEADVFPLKDGRTAKPGPAFATRTIKAQPWSGSMKELKRLVNPEAITRLVVFDTWVRNDDRYPPVDTDGRRQSEWEPKRENLLLTPEDAPPKKLRLVAIDFGRGLTGGRDLPGDLTHIRAQQDEWVYGLFPEFCRFVSPGRVDAAVARLREVTHEVVQAIMNAVPKEWQVDRKAVSAVCGYTCSRAGFLADTIKARLAPLCFPQGRLFSEDAED